MRASGPVKTASFEHVLRNNWQKNSNQSRWQSILYLHCTEIRIPKIPCKIRLKSLSLAQARPKRRKFCPCVGVSHHHHHHHHHQASQAGRGKSTLLAGNLNSRQARQEVSPIPGETSAWLAWWWWWWQPSTPGQDLGRLGHPSVVPSILGHGGIYGWILSFQVFSANLAPLQRMVEDINDQASDFTSNSIALSHHILSRLEDINTRWVCWFTYNVNVRLLAREED